MKGLELCEQYFNEVGRPVLEEECGQFMERMAFGLVGNGSDCYGYDDEISKDHDWGPGFCIWLTKNDFDSFGDKIQDVYNNLPPLFKGYKRLTSEWGGDRIGVLEIGSFYWRFTGRESLPDSNLKWLMIPDNGLAAATNGKVFQDRLGEFSSIRESLEDYYPEDVRLKKLAARCMTMGQAGQYNFPRSVKRGHVYSMCHSEIKFYQEAMSVVFLLNRKYAPYFKWCHQALAGLPILGESLYMAIDTGLNEHDPAVKIDIIEKLCQEVILSIKLSGLSNSDSDYIPDHGLEIQKRVKSPDLSKLSVWQG